MNDGMIFGIGLSKTGTHSLTQALNLLDRPCVHYPDPALMLAGRYDEAFGANVAATDISVSAFFRQLDDAYQGSRFILTTRDIEPWLDSVEDHRLRRAHEDVNTCPKAPVREILYHTRGFDRETFRAAYVEHEQGVREYFANRTSDLLVWDLCEDPRWEPLCEFLGLPVPIERFPRLNARRTA